MSGLIDQLAWRFKPGRFLFGADSTRTLPVLGWETLVFIDDPAQVRDVMRATNDRPDTVFLGGAGNAFLEPLLGEQSIFLLDGDRHRTARSIVGPTLNAKAVQRWTGVIDTIADEELAIVGRKRRRFDLGTWCRHLTMRVMCAAVLDVTDPARTRRIFRRFEATTGYLANLAAYKKGCWRPRGTKSPRRALECLVRRVIESRVRRVDAELYPRIEGRRCLIASRSACPRRPWTPLDALITAQDRHGYDDAFIRDNLVAVLAAGYDTTGAALAWLVFWLSRESTGTDLRKAWDRRDERRVMAFRDEVLRICPPVEILPRRVAVGKREKAQQLIDWSAEIPTGSGGDSPLVCPFVHRAHHDPAVYRSPDVFDPERFLQRSYRPHEFFRYGLGTRMCIGRPLGELVLDRVLRRMLINGAGPRVQKQRFSPVRRNVSIWPGFALRAVMDPVSRGSEEEEVS